MDWGFNIYLGCFVTLITGAVLLAWFNFSNLQSRLLFVPGPIGLPVVGNLPIFRLGSSHQKLAEIANIYGPVFSIKLGRTDVLVLSSIDSVKEALIQRGSDFSGRPSLDSILRLSHGDKSVAYLNYSPAYLRNKQATTAAINILLYNNQSFESQVTNAAQALIAGFMQFQGTYFDPQPLIRSAVAELMFRIIFGDELPSRYVLEAQYLAAGFPYREAFTVGNCCDFLFLPRLLTGNQFQEIDSHYMELVQFIRVVREGMRAVPHSCCIASVLTDSRSRRNSLPLSEDNVPEQQELDDETISYLLAELFVLGCGKISAAIAWMIVFLGREHKLQECLHKELDQELDTSQFLSLADKTNLPILEATILEVFRMACPFPFAIPHSTVRETKVAGYKIPRDITVLINLWACCRDSIYFNNPDAFNPYRFLNDENKQIKKLFCVPSFAMGERRCFGDGLAKGSIFLVTGNLMNNFYFESSEHVTRQENLTLNPEEFQLRAKLRKSSSS